MPFKKGFDANRLPGGRRKEKPLANALKYLLKQHRLVDKNTKKRYLPLPKKPTIEQEIAHTLITETLSGNIHAMVVLWDRVDGKVAQPIQGSDDEEAPPVKVDMGNKELGRRLGFLLLEATKNSDKS